MTHNPSHPPPREHRTATVHTVDLGQLAIAEPAWCLGKHEDGLHAADLLHEGAETTLTVMTRLGPVSLLGACLSQAPLATDLADRQPVVAVDLGGATYSFGPAGLRRLAIELALHAARLRGMSTVLTGIREVTR